MKLHGFTLSLTNITVCIYSLFTFLFHWCWETVYFHWCWEIFHWLYMSFHDAEKLFTFTILLMSRNYITLSLLMSRNCMFTFTPRMLKNCQHQCKSLLAFDHAHPARTASPWSCTTLCILLPGKQTKHCPIYEQIKLLQLWGAYSLISAFPNKRIHSS